MQDQLDAARAELQKLRLSAAASAVKIIEEMDRIGISAAERALERAKADMETAEKESQLRVETAQGDVYAARRYLRELRDMDEVSDMELDDARNTLRKQEQTLDEAYLAQETAIETARRAIEDADILLEQEIDKADKTTQATAADKQRKALETEAAVVDIGLAQRKVSDLEALIETEGIVTADADGVITKINGGVGSLTSGESLFVLSNSSAGV